MNYLFTELNSAYIQTPTQCIIAFLLSTIINHTSLTCWLSFNICDAIKLTPGNEERLENKIWLERDEACDQGLIDVEGLNKRPEEYHH